MRNLHRWRFKGGIGDTIDRRIYGASWDKEASTSLTRTNDAAGMIANVGLDDTLVQNDFDVAPIFGEMQEVEDILGNAFIRIPKFYIRKTAGEGFRSWQVSKYKHPGFYLPWCFWDFVNNKELPYFDYGIHNASLGAGDKLESKSGVHPLVSTNIVNMRTYAQNNNTGGLQGYQQLDIHAYDVLRTLMLIEFADLNIQDIMAGFTSGRYSDDDVLIADTTGNTLIVSNTTSAHYRVGQAISVGTSRGGNQRFYGRDITAIDVDTPEEGQTTITFDGDPVELFIDDILYNTGWKNGFSSEISASSGSIISNSDGKYPCVYRGIENPFGSVWQFVDGVNIDDWQAWVTANAINYASNVFTEPYEQLGYINHDGNGYTSKMGFDRNHPYAEFPVAVGGGSTTYYADYYWQASSQRIARVGGSWSSGAYAGVSYWYLTSSSGTATVSLGGRLLKKAL